MRNPRRTKMKNPPDIGAENASLIESMTRRIGEYPLSGIGDGDGYRSTRYANTLAAAGTALARSVTFDGFDLSFWLREALRGRPAYVTPHLVGLLLDESDQADALLAALQDFIQNDTGDISLRMGFVEGLLKSHRRDAHDFLGDRLRNANPKDKSGDHHRIVALAQLGTRDAFLHLTQIAIDRDLTHNANVLFSFDQWLRLSAELFPGRRFGRVGCPKPRRLVGIVADALRLVADPVARAKALTSDDPLQTYLALCALGTEGLEHLVDACLTLLDTGSKAAQAAALFAARQTNAAVIRVAAAERILNDAKKRSDRTLAALAISCLGGAFGCRLVDSRFLPPLAKEPTLRFSLDRLRHLYKSLKTMLEKRSGGDKPDAVHSATLATTFTLSYDNREILDRMVMLASREEAIANVFDQPDPRKKRLRDIWGATNPLSPGKALCALPLQRDELDRDTGWNLRDDLCDAAFATAPGSLLKYVVRDGSGSDTQRRTLVELFGAPALDVTIWQFAAHFAPTDAEYRRMEDFLAIQEDMPAVFMMILMRDPDGLRRSANRLLEDANPLKRKAGTQLLAYIKKNESTPPSSKPRLPV